MNSPSRIYWDTGVYCGINKHVFPHLIEAERRDNITAHAHPLVILELMCKLSDWMNVVRYTSGRAGIKRLHQHCRDASGLRLLKTIERQVERTMFGRIFDPERLIEEEALTTRMVDECATLDPAAWSNDTRQRIADAAAFKERKVSVELPKMIKAAHDAKLNAQANAEKFGTPQGPIEYEDHVQPRLVDRLVQRTAKTFGVTLSKADSRWHNECVLNTYAIAVHWETLTLDTAYLTGTAGANNLFDAQILYGLTPSLWEFETPIAYVTRERKQVEALKGIAASEVLRLDAYGRARGIEIPND
jgi:hypothetical protein